MATLTYLDHNVVGRRREDYIQLVMGGAETSAVFTTRLTWIESMDVQQDAHASPDKNVNFTLNVGSGGIGAISGATAAHTYRIRATGR